MAQFYQGSSNNSIGAPARVLIAASSYPVPTKLADIVSLSTYLPNSTYGFADLGTTRSPTKVDIQATTQTWRNEQFGTYRTQPTDWKGMVTSEFLETTQANKVAIMLATADTDSATNEHRTNFPSRTSFPIVRVAVMFIDDFGLIHAAVFSRAQWDGAVISQQIGRGQQIFIPMAWNAYPDDSVIDPVSGLPCVRYDFDQWDAQHAI